MVKNIINKNFKMSILMILSVQLFLFSCEKNSENTHSPISSFKDNRDSISYSIGADIGDNLINQDVDIDYDAFLTGLKNGYEKKDHLLSKQDRRDLFKTMQEKMMLQQQKKAKEGLAIAEKYLKDNKENNSDIIETASGLQYRILKEGTGKSPDSSADQVRVHYEGKLVDGTIFDSSYKKGEPLVIRLNRVVKGWTEGVQLMKEGSEFEFFIPPSLGYGERGSGAIPPNSVLIFKVELQKVFEKNIK